MKHALLGVDIDAEVTFTFSMGTGVAGMPIGFIDDLETLGGK